MFKQRSLISESASILNTILSFVVISFLLELVVSNVFFSSSLSPRAGFFLIQSLFFPFYSSISFSWVAVSIKVLLIILLGIKVLVHAGIYGVLAELCFGQEMVVTRRSFKKNIISFWKAYLIVSLVLILIHWLCIYYLPNKLQLMRILMINIMGILGLGVIARIIVYRKYIKPVNLPARKLVLNAEQWLVLIVISAISTLIVISRSALFSFNQRWMLWTGDLVLVYLQFLVFCYFILIILKKYPETNNVSHSKELLLINPSSGGALFGVVNLTSRLYPSFFAILKGLTPADKYRIREFNRVIWRNRYYKPNVLVAISCFTANSFIAYKIAKEFKKQGATVVIGGYHVTNNPDEALEYCDSVVIGEAETVWKQILEDYERNELKLKYTGYPDDDYYSYSHSALINNPPEIIKDCLETARGCRFNCEYCSISEFNQHKIRYKPIDEVIELIAKVRKCYKNIRFLDSNIFINSEYSKELFKRLASLKVNWAGSSSIDIAKDEEALKLARDSGCKTLLIGYEIGPSSSEDLKGKLSLSSDYLALSKRIKKAGIGIKAHFILGFDSDNWKYLINLWWFCFCLSPSLTVFSCLIPFPKTRLYRRLLAENRLVNFNWQEYSSFRLNFKHPHFNRQVMNLCFPLVYLFFFFTTSTYGRFLFLVVILSIVFKL